MWDWRDMIVRLCQAGSWLALGLSGSVLLVVLTSNQNNQLQRLSTHSIPVPETTVARTEKPDWKRLAAKRLQRPVRDPPPPAPPPMIVAPPVVIAVPPPAPPPRPIPVAVLGTMVEGGESRALLLWNGSELLVARVGDLLPPPFEDVTVGEITRDGIQVRNQGRLQQLTLPISSGLP